MKQVLLSSPEDESRLVVLADEIWTQCLDHCANNIDSETISTGINTKKNLFYGRYYNRFQYDNFLKPPLPILDEGIFLNQDVYFIRSTDLLAAKDMPFFVICIAFIKSGQDIAQNGTFSSLVGDHPTISIFVQEHIRYMTNWNLVKAGFERLGRTGTGTRPRSTFVHEFTHMCDEKRFGLSYTYTKGLPNKKPGLDQNTKTVLYVNLNHEVNARYMQLVHAILDSIDGVVGVQAHGIARTFPSFEGFFNYFWSPVYVQSGFIQLVSLQNLRRIQKRLYQFYRYLIEQELKHELLDTNALQFASNQILKDNEHV